MNQNELEFIRDALLLKCDFLLRKLVDNDTIAKSTKENEKEKNE